jgi:hypothetical protein
VYCAAEFDRERGRTGEVMNRKKKSNPATDTCILISYYWYWVGYSNWNRHMCLLTVGFIFVMGLIPLSEDWKNGSAGKLDYVFNS